MNIAVLNECFLQTSHIARLKKLGRLVVYKKTRSEAEAIKRLANIDVAIIHCSLLPITATIIKNAPKLKYVSLASTGYDLVDIKTAKSLGIMVSNLPSYGTESVAEHAIGLMFAVERKIVRLHGMFRRRPFEINSIQDIVTSPHRSMNLRGKTLGIIGLGRIGSRVAEIALAIGMKVIANDCVPKSMPNVEMVSLRQLLKRSDIVTIHTPLDKTTHGLIGARELRLMKPHAVIINTARGKIIQERALFAALTRTIIAGAGIDTLDQRTKSNPLLTLDNVVFTPHSAWYSDESCENIANIVTANVEAFVHGKPVNVIT